MNAIVQQAAQEVAVNYLMSEQDVTTLKKDLADYKAGLVDFKATTHQLAYRTLVHAHNTGRFELVKQFYDTLDQDKLLRKAAYAKWILMYAPAIFDEEKKTFSKDTNDDRKNFFWSENKEVGATLLATANGVRFWDIPGGNEKVNPTLWDTMFMNNDKVLERARKEDKKGTTMYTPEQRVVRTKLISELTAMQVILKPLTTQAQMEASLIKENAVDAEAVEVTAPIDVTKEKAA